MNDFKLAIIEIIKAIVGLFDSNIAKAVEVLSTDVQNDTIFGAVYTTCETIADIIAPIATSICGLCFLIEFIKISIKMDMFKWETAISAMAKFAIAKASLDIAPAFLLAIYSKGMSIIASPELTGGTSNFSDTVANGVETILGSATWYQALAFAATMSLMFVAVMVIGLMVVVMAYGRIFELLALFAVAPLPAAFLCLENSQITKKFFLHFASVVLQGVIMLVVLMIFQSFVGRVMSDVVIDTDPDKIWSSMTSMMGQMLIACITLVTVLMKSGSLAKSVLGQG